MSFEWLRVVGPFLLAVVAAGAIDRLTERAGLLPPGFRPPVEGSPFAASVRRTVALGVLAAVLWVGVFSPLGHLGQSPEIDPDQLGTAQLFLLHALFAVALLAWFALGFGASFGHWASQFGFRARAILRELALGALVGLGAWALVLTVLIGLGLVVWSTAGDQALPQEPPPLVMWIVGLPLGVRLAVSVSAGVVEEMFFRGFLQPRAGIALSTGLFVLAHLSYEQPLMLFGITLLSLIFAFLVRWRQNIWAAIAAHTVFDAVQLLIVIPRLMEFLRGQSSLLASLF